MKLKLGNATHPRRCRLCGRDEPEVTFKDEVPALPTAFGNIIPSNGQDQCIDGQALSLPPFSTPGITRCRALRTTSVKIEHLTGREPVRGKKVPAVFRFDHIGSPDSGGATPQTLP